MTVLAFLDTTVLVAGLVAAHPQHVVCHRLLVAAAQTPGRYRCTTHALAETFRFLVALPLAPRLDAAGARLAIRTALMPRLDPLALTARDYDRAFDAVCASGLGGGAIYDGLHLLAAERVAAQYLVTANLKHFQRLAEAAGTRVQISDPADPALA
jgi:predicted nucleic acid-binding protein